MPSHAAVRPGPFDLYRYKGRHRKPSDTASTARNLAITAGVVAAVMSGEASPATAAPGQPGEDAWMRLRVCESGNNYSINTGNGYYGAYQFDLRTWQGVGGKGLPSQASPLEQDRLARTLYRERGWSPWACARILGLTENPIYGYWAPPVTIRSSTSFVQGARVTVTGTAQPGAMVKVYGTYYGSTTARLLTTVRTGPRGGWTAYVHPARTVSLQAVSGSTHSAAVRATMLYATTLKAPTSADYNGTFTVGGKAHPGGLVTVYVKPYNVKATQTTRQVHVDGAGNWSMVWRASTDFVFSARSDTNTGLATVRVRTTAQAVTTDAAANPADPATPPDQATAAVPLTGTARPQTAVTVYVRKNGTTAWNVLRTVTSDAHGAWSTALDMAGDFEFYAKSANGQSSATEMVSVP